MTPRHVFVFTALACASAGAFAQQLVTGLTGPECSGRGGSIRTWTSTAGITPPRGECWIPPRIGGGGGTARGSGGNSAASALGAAAGVAGAVGNFIDTLNQIEADRQERDRQWEEGLRTEREQWLDQNVARQGDLLQREAELRARERRQPADAGPNPFAADPSAAPNPFAAAAPESFKTDEQIRSECAQSGNAGMCELALQDTRAKDPAYQQWKAAESARLDENVRRSKAEVDRLMAARPGRDQAGPAASPFDPGAMQPQPYNNADPDLAKCREGSAQPWTIAGCYDMQAKPAAKPGESLRDQLRKSLAGGDNGAAEAEPSAPPAQVATAPRAAPPPQQPAEAAPSAANSPWAKGPWRTSDERACRDAGGMMANPQSPNDLTGIPQVVLDNPDVSRAQLAATPYCVKFGMTDSADNERAIRGLVNRTSDAMRNPAAPGETSNANAANPP